MIVFLPSYEDFESIATVTQSFDELQQGSCKYSQSRPVKIYH